MHTSRWLALAVIMTMTFAGRVSAQINPTGIRSGYGGFGYSSMSGTIGSGTGFGQAGYVFIPTLGFRPAYTSSARDMFFFPHETQRPPELHPERRAEVIIKAPGLTDVWVGRTRIQPWGGERSFMTPELGEGEYALSVRAAWIDRGLAQDATRRVKLKAGAKVTVDFSQP
jgi:uncharacterized protein (TIGR03000 family)